jgi:hypothetical protein
MASAPPLLRQRYQPVAFDGSGIRKQVAIGRASLLDDADSAQKSEPAALAVNWPSGPIRR